MCEAIVIDQGSLSYDIADSVYFYKATPGPEFRIGAQEYWDFSGKQHDDRKCKRAERGGVDDDDDDDVHATARRRRSQDVRVRKMYSDMMHPVAASSSPAAAPISADGARSAD